MPEPSGRLTQEEIAAAYARFSEFEKEMGRDVQCEICAHKVWALNPVLSSLLTDAAGGILAADSRIPLLTFYCVHCGNTKHFAGKMWGVFHRDDTDLEEEAEKAKPKARRKPVPQQEEVANGD